MVENAEKDAATRVGNVIGYMFLVGLAIYMVYGLFLSR